MSTCTLHRLTEQHRAVVAQAQQKQGYKLKALLLHYILFTIELWSWTLSDWGQVRTAPPRGLRRVALATPRGACADTAERQGPQASNDLHMVLWLYGHNYVNSLW